MALSLTLAELNGLELPSSGDYLITALWHALLRLFIHIFQMLICIITKCFPIINLLKFTRVTVPHYITTT